MKTKSWNFRLTVVVLTLLIMAIGAVQSYAAPITLRVMTVWGGEAKPYLDQLFAEYSKVNPNVKIVHEVTAGAGAATYQEVLQTGFGAGSGPDVYFEWSGELAGYFIDSGFAEPLEPYYEKYGWDEILIPWAVEALKRNGKVYGVPMSTHGMTFWYRVDLFEELGVEVPTTYAEFGGYLRKG